MLKLDTIACLEDNYAYMLTCEQTGVCVVIDPSEAEPIIKWLKREKKTLSAILNTHHHWDHTGGNEELVSRFPACRVFAHQSDASRVPGYTDGLEHGSILNIGANSGTVLHNPGHTRGAITYVFGQWAFTGDTLFAAGCGRLFEGSPDQLFHSINSVIGGLPDTTALYFGHDYALKNLKFALFLTPNWPGLQARHDAVKAELAAGRPVTGIPLAVEKATNPFFLCTQPNYRQALQPKITAGDALACFTELRMRRNQF
ncbi:MAG: hydroxyacylglutathione hydrolase [Acidobacteria bacterium]|nr:hydroxyacylglutathione hydrolase [Acidobacteriota bacterium]